MRFDVITIFPDMFPGPLAGGVVGRAIDRGLLSVVAHDLRGWAEPPHYQVDDEPYGGGAGMVMKPEPLYRAVEAVRGGLDEAGIEPGPVVLLTPQGRLLDHDVAAELGRLGQMTLICGRYEGVDERVRSHLVDLELSIGDYVLTGGELAAMVLVEAVGRLRPAVLGDPDSARHDSFADGLLDHPQYTRPARYRGHEVPAVLRSGNHGAIAAWRRREALRRTAERRPELLEGERGDSGDPARSTCESAGTDGVSGSGAAGDRREGDR